ncbi:multicopper oxidase family protein [Salininema proteolyticum]|uniref:Multicopper oxidase family protein n=1 Tax=Salininema proteolyticum TaxID=1607685 RepID=A0ABV8TZY0_9ACTN
MRAKRRTLLYGAALTPVAGVLAACGNDQKTAQNGGGTTFISMDSHRIDEAEAVREPGTVREFELTAAPATVDLGGTEVDTWAYDGRVHGPELRIKKGERLKATLSNDLDEGTGIHWHGIALRCDMDGVTGVTQKEIAPGETFTYEFTAPHPGTHWYHPHTGYQLDRGLYGPLIVEDPDEEVTWDEEWVLLLDDWLDGTGTTPDETAAKLRDGMDHGDMGHGDMDMGGSEEGDPSQSVLGEDAGDVEYPHFLINGRTSADPDRLELRPGSRVRLRVINAGGDTAFRLAVGGHRLTVTHTDGFAVEPVEVDSILLGMGERYDAIVEVGEGVFPVVAHAEGKGAMGRALLDTGSGSDPAADERPAELDGKLLAYADLSPAEGTELEPGEPDRTIDFALTGGMMDYDWGINGRQGDHEGMYPVEEGERVRLRFRNETIMWHPMHLHGHTFALADSGVRKDTAVVLPGETVEVDFTADNPGRWMVHCHNLYHNEVGMMTLLGYLDPDGEEGTVLGTE